MKYQKCGSESKENLPEHINWGVKFLDGADYV
jgi:hypothetical protein